MSHNTTPKKNCEVEKLVDKIAERGRFISISYDSQGKAKYHICEPLQDQQIRIVSELDESEFELLDLHERLFPVKFYNQETVRRSFKVII